MLITKLQFSDPVREFFRHCRIEDTDQIYRNFSSAGEFYNWIVKKYGNHAFTIPALRELKGQGFYFKKERSPNISPINPELMFCSYILLFNEGIHYGSMFRVDNGVFHFVRSR